MNSQNGVLYTVGDSVRNDRSVRYIQDSGGNSNGVPPLPIPNREVKPIHADGTAFSCGRVGSRLFKRRFTVGAFFVFCLLGADSGFGGMVRPVRPHSRGRGSLRTLFCAGFISPARYGRFGLGSSFSWSVSAEAVFVDSGFWLSLCPDGCRSCLWYRIRRASGLVFACGGILFHARKPSEQERHEGARGSGRGPEGWIMAPDCCGPGTVAAAAGAHSPPG